MRFDETALVSRSGDDICLNVIDAQDYQLVGIGINPRGTPSEEKMFNFSPGLKVANGKLCIPPDFYHFPDQGQFIIEYVLKSRIHKNEPRSVVVILEINSQHIINLPPTEREIFLPYCRDVTDSPAQSSSTGACQQ